MDPLAKKGWLIFLGATAATFVLGLFVANILERRQESFRPAARLNPVADLEPDNALWGKDFPREYESWTKTAEMGAATKHGGPRNFDHLQRDPHLKTLFAGYPFAVDYKDDRGHMWALDDVRGTGRMDPAQGGKKQPGTCMTCKSSDVPRLMKEMGVKEFYHAAFEEISAKVKHPIGCADCHDAKTMDLRISRPALKEGLEAMGQDPAKLTHQKMRSLVCAQCHVEYYFKKLSPAEKKGTYLTFPWQNGLTVEAMEKYYNETSPHTDWSHKVSGTPLIKMQHPDYEVFAQGLHAARGLACADCHMPYRSQGGQKFADHHIQSPLKDPENTCGVCHRWTAREAIARVEAIQDRNRELLDRAEGALAAAHAEVAQAKARGVGGDRVARAQRLLRNAQLRWDYVAANNGMGFHAPQECARVLGTAIDLAQQARLSLPRT